MSDPDAVVGCKAEGALCESAVGFDFGAEDPRLGRLRLAWWARFLTLVRIGITRIMNSGPHPGRDQQRPPRPNSPQQSVKTHPPIRDFWTAHRTSWAAPQQPQVVRARPRAHPAAHRRRHVHPHRDRHSWQQAEAPDAAAKTANSSSARSPLCARGAAAHPRITRYHTHGAAVRAAHADYLHFITNT